MSAATQVTVDDLYEMCGDARVELIDGEKKEIPAPGAIHSGLTSKLDRVIGGHVEDRRLGFVGVEAGYNLGGEPQRMRVPDISFVSRARIPAGGEPSGYWPFAPDLAVEIVSPHDIALEVEAKIRLYLYAGTMIVWLIWPPYRSITVYQPGGQARVLQADDVLDGGDVLPGFSVRVAEIFERSY